MPKYVKVQPDRQGRLLYYFRFKGVYQPLPDDPESAEFYARYSALLAGVRKPARTPAEGTMAAVIVDYKRSPGYQRPAPKTQRDYDRHLERFALFGGWHISEFKRRHIKEIQKPLNKTPRTAKYFAQVCSLLFAHAVDELDLIELNPAARLKRLDKAEAYKAWSDAECKTFEASNPQRAMLTAYMRHPQVDPECLRWP